MKNYTTATVATATVVNTATTTARVAWRDIEAPELLRDDEIFATVADARDVAEWENTHRNTNKCDATYNTVWNEITVTYETTVVVEIETEKDELNAGYYRVTKWREVTED